MFIGREEELKTLSKHYNSDKFSFIPIYGRRRIGKTRLIEEFIKDKKAIFFTAVEDTRGLNLTIFSHEVQEKIFDASGRAVYESFRAAFADIYEYALKEKLILVIDEYPYLAKSDPSISSILQIEIDRHLIKTDMLLILSGSSMSFMENQVLGYQSPLYGRRSGQIKLLPESFAVSQEYAPAFSKEEQAIMYGVTGGIPKYLSLFDDKYSLRENLHSQFFDKNNFLFEETDNLLKQELHEPAFYKSLITAIATGSSQMKDIASKTGSESAVCSTYLKPLLELGIIKREVPIFDKEDSKKSIYRIADGMFRFWYRFVYQNVSLINLGKGEVVFSRIEGQIPHFMGEVYEKICIEYMWSKYHEMPFDFQNIGRWWGNNPLRKRQEEIDFIAFDDINRKAIFGECKWTNEKVSESVIDQLIEKTEMFNYGEKYYYLFAKNGFTDAARRKAGEFVKLIGFEDM